MSIASEITRLSKNIADSLDAVADKGVTVPSGSTSDDLPDLIAAIQQGGGSAVVVTEEPDSAGGVIKNITAVDLSSDTVDAAHLLSGYTAHDRLGQAVSGSYTPPVTSPAVFRNLQIPSSDFTPSQQDPLGFDVVVGSDGLISVDYLGAGTGAFITTGGTVTTSDEINVIIMDSTTEQLDTQSGTTITPTESQQVAVAAGKYTTGAVNVGAISSSYVGSGITRRSGTDLSASGDTVTVPAGYYSSQATKAVSAGTAGTPTATKGTVSNHSISVTPSVTNTSGYITGSTKTGTAVTVSASELVSGSETKTTNGTYDVTNLAELVVNVASGGSLTVATATWTNTSNTTTSHQFTSLSGTPKIAFLRCTTQLTRSSQNTYYYIADIFWDGTNCRGNYHLRSNGTFNNVATDGGFSVTTANKAITFSSSGGRSSAPGSFYNGTYELVYLY